ncbi:MAG: hypothetical protein EXX96DRAFT_364081 [Benjaminiella poitrasii]|nr:MAG: hypothetical protein EXX96DRAFT_364081 [Benjaminiella poitrasii]
MSTIDDDVAKLKTRIQELEKQETTWKEKLKEEHTQLVNLQKKLTQAGTHLKTLAQENANLTKSISEQKNQKQQITELMKQEKSKWSTKHKEALLSKENEMKKKIQKNNEDHQKEINQLVSILESTTKGENIDNKEGIIPDVSTSTLLDNYIRSVQKRLLNQSLDTKKPKKEAEQNLKIKIEELEKEMKGKEAILQIMFLFLIEKISNNNRSCYRCRE